MEQPDELSSYQEQIDGFQSKLDEIKGVYEQYDTEIDKLRQQFDNGILNEKEYHDFQDELYQKWCETHQQRSELEDSISSLKTEFENSKLGDSEAGQKIADELNAMQAECNEVKSKETIVKNRLKADPLKDIQVVNRGLYARKLVSKAIRGTAHKGIKLVEDTEKKANPLKKRVNKNDASATGIESIRLGYQVAHQAKTTIRTAKTSIRTTKNTIRLAGSTVKRTAQAVRKTAIASYTVVKTTVKVGIFLFSHVIAIAMNPICWVLGILGLVLYTILSSVVLLLGATAEEQKESQAVYSNPVGLSDIPAELSQAVNYYRVACSGQKSEFANMIESFYYDSGNLSYSDLVYMVRNVPAATWSTSLATPTRKSQLINAWTVALPEAEAVAIVYIDLQRQMNAVAGTETNTYEVSFTQEQFDSLLNVCAVHTDTLYYGQECPSKNCTRHVEIKPNPLYSEYFNKANQYAAAYNDWLGIIDLMETADAMTYPASNYYWNANVVPAVNQWQIDNNLAAPSNWSNNNGRTFADTLGNQYERYVGLANSTPKNIETPYYTCDHNHKLHSVGLNFYNASEVMTAYGFTEAEIAWEKAICSSISGYLASTPT